MDEISIAGLEVFGYHGVHKEENTLGQKFVIDVRLFTDTRKAGISDNLQDSVSYGDVIRFIEKEMKARTDCLLERAAERLAESVLLEFDKVQRLILTIKKPCAPVKAHIDYAAVTIERGWHKVYVGAGSNIGDREGWLDMARETILQERQIRRFREACIRETEPYGYENQGRFLNTVYEFETLLSPEELLAFLQGIEKKAGRTRTIHWGPRTLDLDILLYDRQITQEADLVIPHPEMTKRLFVMEPLCDLIPFGLHPMTGERFVDIIKRIKTT